MANTKQKVTVIDVSSTLSTDINTDLDTRAGEGFILDEMQVVAGKVYLKYIHQSYLARGTPSNLAGLKVIEQRIGHADLTADATSETISFSGMPTNAIPIAGAVQLLEEFAGGSVSAITASLGDTGDIDGVMTAKDVFTGAGTGYKHGAGAEISTQTLKTSWAPLVDFQATGDNVVNLSAGELYAWIWYVEVPVETAS